MFAKILDTKTSSDAKRFQDVGGYGVFIDVFPLDGLGNDAEEVKRHIDRRGVEVFPITIEEHLTLLKKCGFTSVNVLWTSFLQAGFWAIK